MLEHPGNGALSLEFGTKLDYHWRLGVRICSVPGCDPQKNKPNCLLTSGRGWGSMLTHNGGSFHRCHFTPLPLPRPLSPEQMRKRRFRELG